MDGGCVFNQRVIDGHQQPQSLDVVRRPCSSPHPSSKHAPLLLVLQCGEDEGGVLGEAFPVGRDGLVEGDGAAQGQGQEAQHCVAAG